ncbi:ABC-three component system middle component 1 [Roseomonas sp. HF4]|uniref:ABC-three component system middle component 1 n=1 Tax=Roseomonas sp. HF4 TaxID=2562313 RepID=UPI0010C02EB8|nr:ABC-three component system middle component 1 [Roseomonas sp. HF4]
MSETASASPAQDALEAGERLLCRRAAELGLTVESKPTYAGQTFAGGTDTTSARLESRDLPHHVHGLQIGRYAVLLTLLPESPNEEGMSDVMRRVRNQCVVARSYLSPPAALDLHVILLGPRSSEGVDRWRALALIAERDERVARKLVWLRPLDASADEQSFADFVKRSFLARPWITDAIFSMAPLDNVSRAAAYGDVPRDTAGEWIRLVSEPDIDPDLLVEELVASWQRRSAR